jgi:hypothetical protein
MSASSPAPTGLPTEYTNLLNDLNRTIHRERPRDILQFCANWFNKRLEEQRIELIHHSSYDPRTFPPSPISVIGKGVNLGCRFRGTTNKCSSVTDRNNLRRAFRSHVTSLSRTASSILLNLKHADTTTDFFKATPSSIPHKSLFLKPGSQSYRRFPAELQPQQENQCKRRIPRPSNVPSNPSYIRWSPKDFSTRGPHPFCNQCKSPLQKP